MRERGKAAAAMANGYQDFNFSAASETPCRKHPNQSAVGICAYCLKERLVRLVCSECGEQRLSSCSCSCSDGVSSSSNRNSYCSAVEVGRVSFLIENDKAADPRNSLKNRGQKPPEQVIFLRRSTSSCVEVRRSRSSGLWRIKRLFRRKKSKGGVHAGGDAVEFGAEDVGSEIWVPEGMGISRSRSLCSFRDEESRSAFSSAKISDVTSGVFLGELEPRKSGPHGATARGLFPARESDFRAMDESAFIDLRVDLSEFCGGRRSCSSDVGVGGGGRGEVAFDQFGGGFVNMKNHGGPCRISVNEKGMKWGGKKSHKVWKWILKYHPRKGGQKY